MSADFEAGESTGLFVSRVDDDTVDEPILSFKSLRRIGICAGLILLVSFCLSLTQEKGLVPVVNMKNLVGSSSHKACIDDFHEGFDLNVLAEPGCIYLLSSKLGSSSKKQSHLVTLCSCASHAPILLNKEVLKSYGIVSQNGKSGLELVATGGDTNLVLYEGDKYDGVHLEVGRRSQLVLKTTKDLHGKTWSNRAHSLLFSSKSNTCAKLQCPENTFKQSNNLRPTGELKFDESSSSSSRSDKSIKPFASFSSLRIVEKPGLSTCHDYVSNVPANISIPTSVGCAYFFNSIPTSEDLNTPVFQVCSCAPYGQISFDQTDLISEGLVSPSLLSLVKAVITGPSVSVSLYMDANFAPVDQLTIGPNTITILQSVERESETGEFQGTWEGKVHSFMLDSWSACAPNTCSTLSGPSALPTTGPTIEPFFPTPEPTFAAPTFAPTPEPSVAGQDDGPPPLTDDVVPTLKPTLRPTGNGYDVCTYTTVMGSDMSIPAQAGCAYFFSEVPMIFPGQQVLTVKICSCSPLGVLSFDYESLKHLGLMNSQGYSRVSYIMTGAMVSVTVYSNIKFQNLRQLTIGPGSMVNLKTQMRLSAIGGGVLNAQGLPDNNPTWDGEVYSLVLNSWTLCNINSGYLSCPEGTSYTGLENQNTTMFPLVTQMPIGEPTVGPTSPTFAPIFKPTFAPTYEPTPEPTQPVPTLEPTHEPTPYPTFVPTALIGAPTPEPTLAPSYGPDVHICQNTLVRNPYQPMTIQPGCAVLLMKTNKMRGKIGPVPMTTICTCDLVGPIFLENSEMQEYGLLGNHLEGEIDIIATGYNVSVTMYDQENFKYDAKKYVIGPSKNENLDTLFISAEQVYLGGRRRLNAKHKQEPHIEKATDIVKKEKKMLHMSHDDAEAVGAAADDDSLNGDDEADTLRNTWSNRVKSISVMSWVPCSGVPPTVSNCYKRVTQSPISTPTAPPTLHPSPHPSLEPTPEPTFVPSLGPSSPFPSIEPTLKPTFGPTPEMTFQPTFHPTLAPTDGPTLSPTPEPTLEPTKKPVSHPTLEPTLMPTEEPTLEPTPEPSHSPTPEPTFIPAVFSCQSTYTVDKPAQVKMLPGCASFVTGPLTVGTAQPMTTICSCSDAGEINLDTQQAMDEWGLMNADNSIITFVGSGANVTVQLFSGSGDNQVKYTIGPTSQVSLNTVDFSNDDAATFNSFKWANQATSVSIMSWVDCGVYQYSCPTSAAQSKSRG